jgi:predicted NAD-dependent protein-ADP-ribosyltransferase YbiA (DUF1768 family)
MPKQILFYRPKDKFGCFSNFSRHTVRIYERQWQTSEHAFQAWKYHPHRPDLVEHVWAAPNPTEAARRGRERAYPIRSDWDLEPEGSLRQRIPPSEVWESLDEEVSRSTGPEPLFARVKDIVMYEVVWAKFEQNTGIKGILMQTEPCTLVEDAEVDAYWGWGPNRTGHNKLGRILMAVRQSFGLGVGKPACL